MNHLNQLTELEYKRLQKQAAKTKQSWDDIDGIYQTIAESIVTVLEQVNQVISTINQLGAVERPQELAVAIDGIRRDSEHFTQDLLKIKKRHQGHSGIINNEDELALCLSVFSDYTELHERFRSVTFNPMLVITEALAELTQRIKEGNQA